jgi:hypothetical protein
MVMVLVPPAIAQSTLKEAAARSTDLAGDFANSLRAGSKCWPLAEKWSPRNVRIAGCRHSL